MQWKPDVKGERAFVQLIDVINGTAAVIIKTVIIPGSCCLSPQHKVKIEQIIYNQTTCSHPEEQNPAPFQSWFSDVFS